MRSSTERQLGIPRKLYDRDAAGPLAGVRVLDLTRLIAGGQLGVVLGDLGADVVKVEQPGAGDPLRSVTAAGYDAHWRAYARNKRSVTLNLKDSRGRELLLRLAEQADVLAENYAPGVLERLCGGPEALLERNPRLVVTRISGWGQTGPLASRPGFGTLAEAFSGFTHLNGPADGPPHPPPMSLADAVAGTYAAAATVAALFHVRSGGAGQVVDVSLYEPLFSILGPEATVLAATGATRKRGDSAKVSSVRGVFETSDGHWLALSAATDEIVLRLFGALARLEILDDPRFATSEARLANRDALHEIVAMEFATRTREEMLALAEANRITIGPVYDVVDLVADEHVHARETIVEMVDEDGEAVAMHNIVPRLSRTPGTIRRPAPRLGEHNAELLGELGIEADELHALEDAGVI